VSKSADIAITEAASWFGDGTEDRDLSDLAARLCSVDGPLAGACTYVRVRPARGVGGELDVRIELDEGGGPEVVRWRPPSFARIRHDYFTYESTTQRTKRAEALGDALALDTASVEGLRVTMGALNLLKTEIADLRDMVEAGVQGLEQNLAGAQAKRVEVYAKQVAIVQALRVKEAKEITGSTSAVLEEV
jgi:hypothetical protein